mgnify:CR=1 FL=1
MELNKFKRNSLNKYLNRIGVDYRKFKNKKNLDYIIIDEEELRKQATCLLDLYENYIRND